MQTYVATPRICFHQRCTRSRNAAQLRVVYTDLMYLRWLQLSLARFARDATNLTFANADKGFEPLL